MDFKKILLEQTLTTEEALALLGINKFEKIDSDSIRTAYRKAAMLNHPDKGGSADKMKMINLAYERLKGYKGNPLNPYSTGTRTGTTYKYDAEAAKEGHRRNREMGVAIKNEILSQLKPEVFIKYLNELSGMEFFFTLKSAEPKGDEKYSLNYVTIKSEFHTKDHNTFFTFDVQVSLADVANAKGKLGGADTTYNMYATVYGFHNNKKQKITQRDWKSTQTKKIFTDPEEVFPKIKLKKIFGGETRKNSKFKKSDMIAYIERKLKGTVEYSGTQVWASIPIKDVGEVRFYRTTLGGRYGVPGSSFATWNYFSIRAINKQKISSQEFFSFLENERTAKFFEELQKSKTPEEVILKLKHEHDKLKKEAGL